MRDDMPSVEELVRVIDEVRALFHVLKAAAEQVHGEGERSAARRGVLLGLAASGPQTVPQIARSRPVSRQHIQMVVNSLAEDDLVELVENPAHKRSRLVRLTDRGRSQAEELVERETAVFGQLDVATTPDELARAAATLATVRQGFVRLLSGPSGAQD